MTIPNFNQNDGEPYVGVPNPSHLDGPSLVNEQYQRVVAGEITPEHADDGAGHPVRVVVLQGKYFPGDLDGDAYFLADVLGNCFDALQLTMANAVNAGDWNAAAAARAQIPVPA